MSGDEAAMKAEAIKMIEAGLLPKEYASEYNMAKEMLGDS